MVSRDDENERLAYAEYWDGRYTETVKGEEQVHEWLRSFKDLEEFFNQRLFQAYPPASEPHIVHLGSGDSTIPQHLAAKGYNRQLCVDFSAVVVKTMSQRHAELGLSDVIRWEMMDVRHMDSITNASVDAAFDKSTLDVMIHGSPWNPPDDTVKNTGEYLREVSRILKPSGVYLAVSYRQPHFVRPLLECEGTNWNVEIEHLGAEGSFGYSAIICKPLPRS